jgi:hypothetical protein
MDLDSILKMARNKPMNVALVLGKEGLSIAGDPRKGLDAMWREAKAAAGGAKGGMGVCNVVGKEIQIQFADEYPGTLKKAFKELIRNQGLKFKPVFIGADGTVDGADEDEEGIAEGGEADAPTTVATDAGAADGAAEDPDADLRKHLLAEFDAFRDELDRAKSACPPPAVKKLEWLEQTLVAEIEKAPKKAASVLGLLKKTAEGFIPSGGGPASTSVSDERKMGLASLGKAVDALLAEFT